MILLSPSTEKSYYQRYCSAAKRFEWIGAAILIAGILLNATVGSSVPAVTWICAAIGACLLIIGGSSLRPHNIIKSFARQCIENPSDAFAQGLLDALEAAKKVQLVSSSIVVVEQAVTLYEQFDDSDPVLAQKLRRAFENRVVKKAF